MTATLHAAAKRNRTNRTRERRILMTLTPSEVCYGEGGLLRIAYSGEAFLHRPAGAPYECPPLSVMSESVAPVGSLMTEKRPTFGMSVGGTQTFPPNSSTRFAEASTSSTA